MLRSMPAACSRWRSLATVQRGMTAMLAVISEAASRRSSMCHMLPISEKHSNDAQFEQRWHHNSENTRHKPAHASGCDLDAGRCDGCKSYALATMRGGHAVAATSGFAVE